MFDHCELTQFQLLLCKPIDYFLLITTELSPAIMNELQNDDELKSQFNQLLNATIFSTNNNSSEEETRALNEHVQHEVTAKPILARIMKGNASLLSVACTNLDDEYFHPAIKCIIGANPSALLWDTATYIYTVERMIHKVAGHPTLCVLMPWIAANYHWVLDHEILCLEDPPVFCLINQYANRGATKCSAAIIQQFFEAFPRGLTQINKKGFTPLHAIICRCKHECEPDLFKWLTEQEDRGSCHCITRSCSRIVLFFV